MPISGLDPSLKRKVRVHLRELQILSMISQGSVSVFTTIVVGSDLLVCNIHTFQSMNDHPSFGKVLDHYV
jgi:galactitol-specific phosphotransferase system IIB component